MKHLLLFLWVVLGSIAGAEAQSVADLHAKKSALNQQIKQLQTLLKDNSKSKQKSISELRLLQLELKVRKSLINDMGIELRVLRQRIENNQRIVELLEQDLVKMKEDYAAMIRLAQVHSNTFDALLFLLSAENASQAYSRWLYLRQYAQYRSKQLDKINSIAIKVQQNLHQIQIKKQDKERLMAQKQQELLTLGEQEVRLGQVLQSFESKHAELKMRITTQQEVEKEMKGEIEQLLTENAKKNLAENTAANVDFDQLTRSFQSKKGKLPWPVKNGVITEKFGEHDHPVLPHIKVRSNGVEIAAALGVQPEAVCDGVVSKIFELSGGSWAVILRHGTYLTVYANLTEVLVKVDEPIAAGQHLGKLSAKGGISVLKFQVWKENTKLNPEEWLLAIAS